MKKTILVSSAGRRNQLVECFRSDARALGIELRILTCDMNPQLSSACQTADKAFSVPACKSQEFIPEMLRICLQEEVDLLIPTIDPELESLSHNSSIFALQGTTVAISDPSIVRLSNDKLNTAKVLSAGGIPTPKTLTLEEYLRSPGEFSDDVIAKPIQGSASIGIIRGTRALDLATLPISEYLVQQLWHGKEYTVNVYFDKMGKMRCAIPHLRMEVRGGEVSKGRTERVAKLCSVAEKIGLLLSEAKGPICFQAIQSTGGDIVVFEINARFGGGYPLAHAAGARFSKWLLEDLCGFPSSASNNWKENLTMLRFDEAVYVENEIL